MKYSPNIQEAGRLSTLRKTTCAKLANTCVHTSQSVKKGGRCQWSNLVHCKLRVLRIGDVGVGRTGQRTNVQNKGTSTDILLLSALSNTNSWEEIVVGSEIEMNINEG